MANNNNNNNVKKGLAVFSGSQVVHKLMQDGRVQFGSGSNLASVVISGSLTASADSIEVSSVRDNFTATTLGGILVELKQSGSTGLSDLDTSLRTYIDAQDIVVGNAAAAALGVYTASNNSEIARVDGRITTLIGGGDIASTLDTIKEIADFLDGDGAAAVDLTAKVAAVSGALAQEILDRDAAVDAEQQRAEGVEEDLQDQINSLTTGSTQAVDNLRSDFNSYTGSANGRLDTLTSDLAAEVIRATGAEATLTSDLTAEVTRATGAEAGLQSQIDASAFKVNDMSVNAKTGSFTIVGSSNIDIGSTGGVVTVSLNESVTLAGTLSANVVSASAGLSVVGGASVAGGMTVSSGDVEVSHGTIKSVMDGTTDATALTALASAAATSDGKFFYLKGSHASWARPDCWYFCQGGDWFDAPFYGEG